MRLQTLLMCLVVSAGMTGCRRESTGPAEVPSARVDGQQVTLPSDSPQRNALVVDVVGVRKADVIRLTGRLIWDEDATVRVYTPVGGRVTEVIAGIGDRLTAGALLARVASPDYEQAQADVRKATADLLLADRSYKRVKELADRGAAAAKDLEVAEDAYTAAASEKARTIARLAVYGGSPDAANPTFLLRAPVAGVVVDRNVSRGQEVRPDQMLGNVPQAFLPLFVITDPTRLWVVLDATETDMPRLRPGLSIQIRSGAYPAETFAGSINVVGDALDPTTRTVKVRGSVPNPGRLLKAEMYVAVEVGSDAGQSAEIPAKAVFRRNDTPFVFVETGPGRFERRPVKLGSEVDGRVAVLDGLQAGQRVVSDGCLLLQAILDGGGTS